MSDETAQNAVPNVPEPAATPAPEPKPEPRTDPYDDLPDEVRSAAVEVDKLWSGASAAEKLEFMRRANAYREAAAKPDPAPAHTPRSDEPPPDRLSSIEKALHELIAERKNEREAAAKRENLERFNRTLDSVLSEFDEFREADKPARDRMKRRYYGDYLENPPHNLSKAFREFVKTELEEREAEVSRRQEARIRGKLEDARATRGETRGGNAPAKEVKAPTADDLLSGQILDDVIREMGR